MSKERARKAAESAGILLYKRVNGALQVLIVHPGGPFWSRRDAGSWSIPKGEIESGEAAEVVARREFVEEVGPVPAGVLQPLGAVRQRGGKRVTAFALAGDFDVRTMRSNTFEMEWPPRSGRRQTFPEIDRAAWLSIDKARDKLNPAQAEFLERLVNLLETLPDTSSGTLV